MATGDRDAFQLASELTTILQPVRAGQMARIGPAEVRLRYGVEPAQVPDFIALRGDPSDKLPGAKGVGPKGAAGLLRKYGTLEEALVNGRFKDEADSLRLYRRIATMDKAAPVPSLQDQTPTWARASALARDWERFRYCETAPFNTVNWPHPVATAVTAAAGASTRPLRRAQSRLPFVANAYLAITHRPFCSAVTVGRGPRMRFNSSVPTVSSRSSASASRSSFSRLAVKQQRTSSCDSSISPKTS